MPARPRPYLSSMTLSSMFLTSLRMALPETDVSIRSGSTPNLPCFSLGLTSSRTASRNSRLMRFRSAAEPCLRVKNMPYLNWSSGKYTSVQNVPGYRLPNRRRCEISTRLFRLKRRGRLLLFPANSYRQSFSALGAATVQDPATALGPHAPAKPVVVEFLAIRRLKCSFHSIPSLLLYIRK